MTTIYVVTSGIYSDYKIEAVFSNKEDAQYLANIITNNSWPEGRVEEYSLDEYSKQGIDDNAYWYFEYYPKTDEWKTDFDTKSNYWRENKVNNVRVYTNNVNSPVCYAVTTRGESRDAALKIANEKIMMAIAGGL